MWSALLFAGALGCTMVLVTPGASEDGSAMVAHTDDGGGVASDLRLVYVPAADHPTNSMRPVYDLSSGYPRLVDKARSPLYAPLDGQVPHQPLGYIPQVAHTYAYWDQDYGLMNEHQLAIAESTCNARTVGWPSSKPFGSSMFGIAELSKVALERCTTARCAAKTMGDLAVEHGFFSEDSGDNIHPGYGDSAECLGITDKSGEAWVFNVLTGPLNKSAIWAAARVPDGEVHITANSFTIRHLDINDKENYMGSPDVYSAAIENKWWDRERDGPFDFYRAYGMPEDTETGLYAGRRMWRFYDLVNPNLHLNPYLGHIPGRVSYPFSVRPVKQLSLQFLFQVLRDYYAGTEFDMTKGLAAGPFGSPLRYDGTWFSGVDGGTRLPGGWERPISMYRTLFSFVAQTRSNPNLQGLFWYGQHSPHGAVYVPFYCHQNAVPPSYNVLVGSQSKFSRESAWWAFAFVNNWMALKFSFIIEDVKAEQTKLELAGINLIRNLDSLSVSVGGPTVKQWTERATTDCNSHARDVVSTWWDLSEQLIAKYADGYITLGERPGDQHTPGYPMWWYQTAGYFSWPGNTFIEVTHDVPKGAHTANANSQINTNHNHTNGNHTSVLMTSMLPSQSTIARDTTLVLGGVGLAFLVLHIRSRWTKLDYEPIP